MIYLKGRDLRAKRSERYVSWIHMILNDSRYCAWTSFRVDNTEDPAVQSSRAYSQVKTRPNI
jgi:hypothetical protein